MAYVLGFFCADGSMSKNKRGAHFIEFQITDKDLLEKIRKLLDSDHKITERERGERWKTQYRLQIGSKTIFRDLTKLGLTPHKSKTLSLPKMPNKYLSHFTRGYFDGDGNVNICTYQRKNRLNRLSTVLLSGFTCGSEKFVKALKSHLKKFAHILGGTLYYSNKAYRLYFSINDSKKLYDFMYKNHNNLCLNRKKIIFEKYFS